MPKIQDEPQAGSLSLYTQNIYALPFGKNLKCRVKKFMDFVDNTPKDEFLPDVVTVNEAFTRYAKRQMGASAHHPYFEVPKYQGARLLGSGLATLSANPILESEFIPFIEAENTDTWVCKGAMRTVLQDPELGEVALYATHTQSSYKINNLQQYADIRRSQIEQILAKVREKDQNRIVILAGDFNIQEDEFSYELITRFEGFTDVMREMHPDHPLHTWRKANPYVADKNQDQRLDYVFVKPSQGWQWDKNASTGQIVRPCLEGDGELCLESENLSDHDGVYTDLKFTRTAPTP